MATGFGLSRQASRLLAPSRNEILGCASKDGCIRFKLTGCNDDEGCDVCVGDVLTGVAVPAFDDDGCAACADDAVTNVAGTFAFDNDGCTTCVGDALIGVTASATFNNDGLAACPGDPVTGVAGPAAFDDNRRADKDRCAAEDFKMWGSSPTSHCNSSTQSSSAGGVWCLLPNVSPLSWTTTLATVVVGGYKTSPEDEISG